MSDLNDMRPLCFVLMPFGTKADPTTGGVIEFDAVYQQVYRPAVEAAGLRPIRADEEQVGGIIHKPMFERLILCEYAVADLTSANANVYYELGIRHAVRPWSTVLTFAEGFRLPFDLGSLRAQPYHLNQAGHPSRPDVDREALADKLRSARRQATDSPIFQLVDEWPPPDVSRLKTDVFRERVEYSSRMQEQLARARTQGPEAVRAIRQELGDLLDAESGVIVDLLLSFRAVEAYDDMIELVESMPDALAHATLVQEQYAFGLNRAGKTDEAEQLLLRLLDERGPSSETYGLLGRVYKDRWEVARAGGEEFLARGVLDQAIDAYVKGFESDWRDQYPGINAVQLMTLREPPDPRCAALLPVVRYSVQRRLASGKADYWDHASMLEIAVLDEDQDAAFAALADARAHTRETWEPRSTLATLRRLREARERRGHAVAPWMVDVERELQRASGPPPAAEPETVPSSA